MILELDIGNTRVKWRVRTAEGRDASRGACALEDLLDGPVPGASAPVTRLRAGSVRGIEVERRLADWARGRGIARVDFARVTDGTGGLRPAYADLARLGVDRWLAMLAAFASEHSAVCVIQCGSAITVDLVDDSGRHLGGLIAPGLRLMQRSLLADTDRVRFAPDAGGALEAGPGVDTDACVRSGVANAAAGAIERACAHWRVATPGARVLISGGDAERLLPLLDLEARLCPELVLDGLAVALP